ncbi:RNA deprotection pyrophosphohydrolase [Desertibacillus haloalkaliphilus]|uniref:RNA deprotection pyrophosphohydrolase n=1 Tax=Desertibacillus haloalkaliphilus TaxID=1328930 RepID=UPI001C27C902|nr:nucleoside triphosphatase YtkD [Desertibacillus haloalkaliphilus]MBU8905294.1 nucleoside triphosphatase YtkD [Desertibacillus haloalkaliphilus]
MLTFKDYYGHDVRLSFSNHPFSNNPKHVWVVCRFRGQWLLTSHSGRGLEFPGGKVENGEHPEDAASREVFEETGGYIRMLTYIGQYEVTSKADTLVKNIYYAVIDSLEAKADYLETNGPVLIDKLPEAVKKEKRYSFIMKDEVLPLTIEQLQKRGLL